MKYFVADTTAEMGIRQLSEDKITLLHDGDLVYKHPETGERCKVSAEHWATDFDKMVEGAFNKLNEEIEKQQAILQPLLTAKEDLIAASPKLQRITNQLKLF